MDQTGPKIQLGGFHEGLFISVYQLLTLDVVASEPMNAARKQIAMEITSPIKSFAGDAVERSISMFDVMLALDFVD